MAEDKKPRATSPTMSQAQKPRLGPMQTAWLLTHIVEVAQQNEFFLRQLDDQLRRAGLGDVRVKARGSKRGRKQFWTDRRYEELLFRYAVLLRDGHSRGEAQKTIAARFLGRVYSVPGIANKIADGKRRVVEGHIEFGAKMLGLLSIEIDEAN
jgi:hypothetical protein